MPSSIDLDFSNQSVIFLMGPTASGKTGIAIALAQQLPIEIISVDSALVYKDMNIGTAKPTEEELIKAPHHLIDFLDPAQNYSVAQFREDALYWIENIFERGKIPLLVGGTQLYHRALLYGLSDLPQADPKLREKFQLMVKKHGLDYLHQQLAHIDSAAAAKIHPNDPQRIIRALEVYELTGQALSQLQQQSKKISFPFAYKKIILNPSREILRENIAIRFHQMLEQGFVDEVRKLYSRDDLDENMPSMRAVGYRQVWSYLAREIDYQQMIELAINATRQFAKRQVTWLRKEQDGLFLNDYQNPAVLLPQILDYLQLNNN